MEKSAAETFIQQKPHVVLSMSWVSTWVRQLFYLSEANEEVKAYNNFYSDSEISKREPFGEDLIRCINDFYTYFLERGSISEVNRWAFENLPERFGEGEISFPLRQCVLNMSERDRHMFKSLTVDVFLAVCNPVVANEIGRTRTETDEYIYMYLLRPLEDPKYKKD